MDMNLAFLVAGMIWMDGIWERDIKESSGNTSDRKTDLIT
jgi:hypothetical protein